MNCPHKYLSCYRLEADMSWTPAEKLEQRSQELTMLNKIFTAQKALTETPVLNLT